MKSQNDLSDLLRGDFEILKCRAQSEVGFYHRNGFLSFIDSLQKQLNLNRFMSPDQLIKALTILENLEINSSRYRFMHELLNHGQYRLLHDIVPDAPKASGRLKCPYASMVTTLRKLHCALLSHLELSLVHIARELPVSKVNYEQGMLDESQAFRDLENTSKASHLPDKSTSVKDFARRGVTLYGTVVYPSSSNNDKDPAIIGAIEGFGNSSIASEGTPANKIYQFGGQFLEAVMLNEFSHTTEFKQSGKQGIQPGLVKGHINWTKVNSSIVGQVTLDVLTLNQCDLDNKHAMQKFYAIGSDGISLLEVSESELELINQRCSDEVKGTTDGQVVPVCTLAATLAMPLDITTGMHYLKVSAFTVRFNTDELRSTREYDFRKAFWNRGDFC
ncbi:hypothetical protein GH742_09225 [Legionella sp. MW5194]|uniref:hypothetical protein n=1 Tax=Legionella sp. MW5194 TaxID=2662448 RepID=UPI00193E367E|nr:hypothetical protein [Legionella sp. MW5194]QRN04038.1 hypothetical protein GH742_09225 [Legionella sp. MW5194]